MRALLEALDEVPADCTISGFVLVAGSVEVGTHHGQRGGQTRDGQEAASGVYFMRVSVAPRTRAMAGYTLWHRLMRVR